MKVAFASALLAAASAAAGCSSLLGIDDLRLADAMGPGNGEDGADARCIGGGLLQVCPEPAPDAELVIDGPRQIDTDTDPACVVLTSGTIQVCALVHTSIEIATAATLRATGRRPLVLAAMRSISVAGSIDVSSGLGRGRGAGGNPAVCPSVELASGGAGGPGGSFGGAGGDGGTSGNADGPPSAPPDTVTEIRGGCAGGRGGNAGVGQLPGAGGGAVYLMAREQIVIAGRVNASGAGGAGGTNGGFTGVGGAGGGAGGLIGLDAPAITGSGMLFANGGGGGGGAGTIMQGAAGGESTEATAPGLGGTGSARGGNGSAGPSLTGARGSDGGGGGGGAGAGGGGGGAGAIYVRGALSVSGAISPPPRP